MSPEEIIYNNLVYEIRPFDFCFFWSRGDEFPQILHFFSVFGPKSISVLVLVVTFNLASKKGEKNEKNRDCRTSGILKYGSVLASTPKSRSIDLL